MVNALIVMSIRFAWGTPKETTGLLPYNFPISSV